MGANFGTVVTWSLLGVIIEGLGWHWAFYTSSFIVVAFSLMWLYIVADTPAKHPRIMEEEKKFIEDSLGATVSNQKRLLPMFSVLKSIPFWTLLILHYGNLWGLYFLVTASPKFMNEVRGKAYKRRIKTLW